MTIPLYRLEFGSNGKAVSPAQVDRLIAECKLARVTDVIFLAHGFRCDAANATALFTALLGTLGPNLDRAEFAGNRKFAAVGVYWPSLEFRESFGASGTAESIHSVLAALRGFCTVPDDAATLDHAERLVGSVRSSRNARDEFVACVLRAFDDGRGDPTEGIPLLHIYRGSDLLDAAGQEIRSPAPMDGEGGLESIPVVDNVLRGVDTFLNFMTFNAMNNLSGKVGANGLAASVIAVRQALGKTGIHLVGHSLGGRLVTACCKSLAQQHAAQTDSLSLLEAAFSHFGFSPNAGSGETGFFREVIVSRIVRGAMISTFSKQDAAVGTAYALASRLARARLQAIGDASDPYGGIGHNGAQRTPESRVVALGEAGRPYQFRPGVVTCLDGSAGLITRHDDVTNQHVTWAVASAICGED